MLDDGLFYVLEAMPNTITVPDTFWLVAEFTTAQAGRIIAEAAEIGEGHGALSRWSGERSGTSGLESCIVLDGADPTSVRRSGRFARMETRHTTQCGESASAEVMTPYQPVEKVASVRFRPS